MKHITSILTVGLALACIHTIGANHPELKPYPAAKDGMERHVIVLPEKARGIDNDFRVELIAGKTMMTDGVNQQSLGTVIERKTLKGWGYSYYDVIGGGNTMSTRIGVPKDTPKVEKFVHGQSLHIRYNSRLPIVIYAPKGIEVRYRIWKATPDFRKAAKD